MIRDNDRTLQGVLDTISALDLWSTTAVVRTADHGELGGSHGGLRGKGPLPYEQETHVPMVVVHPEHPGGRTCKAVTSHIDLVPTLAGLTNADAQRRASALTGLPGHDFTSVEGARTGVVHGNPRRRAVQLCRAVDRRCPLHDTDGRDLGEDKPCPPSASSGPT